MTVGHIDPSTGRNKRDKSPVRALRAGSWGGGVPRRGVRGKGRRHHRPASDSATGAAA